MHKQPNKRLQRTRHKVSGPLTRDVPARSKSSIYVLSRTTEEERGVPMRTVRALRALGLGAALLLAGCEGGGGGDSGDRAFLPLEFPFSNPADIVKMSAFGIPNWSGTEPHNGIDLVVSERRASAALVSPAAGTVTSITTSENPYSHPPGQLILDVAITINSEWAVHLVLEPGTADPNLKAAQMANVLVTAGREVSVGTPVANLLVGTSGYPHLHYMLFRNDAAVCAYEHSSDAAKRIFERIARLPGGNLPGGNICSGGL